MKTYKIEFKDGRVFIDSALKVIDLVRKYDLATKENIGARISEIETEDSEIDISPTGILA